MDQPYHTHQNPDSPAKLESRSKSFGIERLVGLGIQSKEGGQDNHKNLEINPVEYSEGDRVTGGSNMTRRFDLPKKGLISRVIYILGAGNIGSFVAHSLAGISNRPPVALLLSHNSFRNWNAQGGSISLETNGVLENRKGFEVELSSVNHGIAPTADNTYEPIDNLIVCVKGPSTVNALSAIAPRLTPDSTILFLHNGMGILDEINKTIFPDIEKRPNYMLGIITHGLFSYQPFKIKHAGQGSIAMGAVPKVPFEESGELQLVVSKLAPSARYLLRTFTRTPALRATGFGSLDLLQLQIEKLAVNAIINPLTALLECKNGEILHNSSITRVIRLLLSEISLVIRNLPELQHVPNLNIRFSPERLELNTFLVAQKTANNESSMLQDVRKGIPTEIDYINGYIVRRGEELGIKCVMNYMLVQMVSGKSWSSSMRLRGILPLKKHVNEEIAPPMNTDDLMAVPPVPGNQADH